MMERPPDEPAADGGAAALAACPHLRSVDGPWHAATPSRAHRCSLLAEGRPTLDRQRAHCLVAEHVSCPTWLEARGSEASAPPGPFVRTAPVVLEGPGVGLPAAPSARRLAGPVTAVVVALALGSLLLARGPLAPGSSSGAGDDGPSLSAAPSDGAMPSPSVASTPAPTAGPTARPSASPRPTATPRPRTYKVQPGDTLTSIAVQHGTTVKKLAALNGIENPSLIRVGQVLKLP